MLTCLSCIGQEICKPGRPVKTPVGELVTTRCTDAQKYPTKKYISLSCVKILESSYLSEQSFNAERTYWIFRGNAMQDTACPDRLYLIDITISPVKVIAFGVKSACNEFQSASWGEKRSVISIKNNVKFIYENGKITLPLKGKILFESIEPPHAGAGLSLEDAIPFAEDVPPPA
jgi:hypothetical protein